jgi:predicted MFS family arabinose efflux permease
MDELTAEVLESEAVVLETPPEETAPKTSTPEDKAEFRRRVLFIGMGVMLVSLAYPDTGIGELPLRYMLHDGLRVSPDTMAWFFFAANIPSWCKPALGIFSDSVPLFGTRRRSYMLLGCIGGILLWLLMLLVPRQYAPMLAMAVALNAMATIGGTINGAVLIEEGQKRGATGRLSSLRSICINAGAVLAGPLGGWLAARAFGWTCVTGAALFAALLALTYTCLREKPNGRRDAQAWRNARAQVAVLARSGPLWMAAGMVFLLRVAPGFSTPLFYYQTDTLKFSPEFIGVLAGVSSAVAFLAGFVYYFLCRRMTLRPLIVLCMTVEVLTTLAFVFYRDPTSALLIRAGTGLGATLAFLALFDLAARATPKGSEAMGYAILYAFLNIGLSCSDVIGSRIFEFFHRDFNAMVFINAAATALIFLVIPFLPRALVSWKDGEKPAQ